MIYGLGAHLSRQTQHHRRRRIPQAGVQRTVPAESARRLHVYRRGHTGSCSRPGESAPISPIFSSAFPTPAPSPTATPTSTFASPCMAVYCQRRLARAADSHHQCGAALGLRRADDGAVRPPGESRCGGGFTAVAPVAGQRSGGARHRPALSLVADPAGPHA